MILKGFIASSKVSSKKSTTRSKQSTAASTAIKRAVLVVETAALEERAKIKQQMLELQQKAKQLELTMQIEKLWGELEVLEEEEQEEVEEGGVMERVQGWIETQLQVPREPNQKRRSLSWNQNGRRRLPAPKKEPQVRQYESLHLDPRALAFRLRRFQQEVPVTASIITRWKYWFTCFRCQRRRW